MASMTCCGTCVPPGPSKYTAGRPASIERERGELGADE